MAIRRWKCVFALAALMVWGAGRLDAATIHVAAGGDLQGALDAARPGDTVLLAEGAEFVGNFVLPAKTGSEWITLRTAAPDSVLPAAGIRIRPSDAPLLARLRSPNPSAALRTAPGAHHWDIRYLEFAANQSGYGDIIQIGDGSSAQNTLDVVPHHIVLNHVYVHGDPRYGQKRGIALNAAHVTISDSFVSECKGVGQDTQAIAGWNGPGPYLIENNYLEGAGENVMFGGADPAIPNLVADGITFRRNYLSRPMSWRQPIIGTPHGVGATAEAGGSLPSGVYAYRVVARGSVGQGLTGRSTASAEVTATLTSAGAVRLRWEPVAGAAEYRVYGRTAGAQATAWSVTATEFVDVGATGTTEAVPTTSGTAWSVKNLFELKNARNVVVEENIFQNHWKESQPGWAIVLTPRNSNGACTWCVVENVRFERNVVRNVAAGINILGYDIASRPTRQSTNIVIRQNLFHRVTTALGGNGWFIQVGDEPRDLTIEHNTVEHDGTTLVYTYGGTSTDPRQIQGLVMKANAARHGSYGMGGSYFTYGLGILTNYYPAYVFSGNYLAGGSATRYPSGNIFAGVLADQFVDPAGGDFTLRAGSILRGAADDATDIGADFGALKAAVAGVETGVLPTTLAAAFTTSCVFLECSFADVSSTGSSTITSSSWSFGDGNAGSGSSIAHAYVAGGSYLVTLTVTDATGASSSSTNTVTVEAANAPPTASFTSACVHLTCTFTDASVDIDGSVVSWAWSAGSTSTSAERNPSFTFPAAGTYGVTLAVADDDGAVGTATGTVTVTAAVAAGTHVQLAARSTTSWVTKSGKSRWSAEVTLVAEDASERTVRGATITVTWTGAVNKSATCVTNTSGTCSFSSGAIGPLRTKLQFTIDDVAAPSGPYDPSANHDAAGGPLGTVVFDKP
jgi:PKD repeat protein